MNRLPLAVALVTAIVAAPLLLGGCSLVDEALRGSQSASHPPANAGIAPDRVGCVEGTAIYTQTSSRNVLTTTCATVTVSGNGISLTAANVTHLTLSGNNITAGVAVVGDLVISGSNDTLKLTGVGPVTISGSDDTLTAIGSIGDVTVVGSNNTVSTPGKIGTIVQTGQGNHIGSTG
ncbi:MAG TPA: hypothetical protein VHX87_02065 [Galbitalea sp.]|jgi:hypothetical protein|nr:hypothetical protein [Galbitalea sp.]